MKLLGKAFDGARLLSEVTDSLRARGLAASTESGNEAAAGEGRVDPLSFNLWALEEHGDPTRGLPLNTHRGGAGRVVLLAKWAFRKSCQLFINEALGRQRVFNGHVRDSYAQLAAEVLRLRRDVEAMHRIGAPVAARPSTAKQHAPDKRKGKGITKKKSSFSSRKKSERP